MIKLSELQPDGALKELLEGKIIVAISDTESRVVEVYQQGERPNINLGDEFIDVLPNGAIQSIAKPMGVYRGNLAIVLYCKAQSDGTSKSNRINSMISQLESLVSTQANGKYFFEINLSNIITPLAYNATTGYTTMTLNIEWHTTE